ncbi:MAG: DEAD/DEAH box helicase [Opitutaceae bacterium]|nr:DEAD/DEAH box helicase [Opitutaceae bacterium]
MPYGPVVQIEALAGLQKLMLPDRWQAEAIQALKAGRDVVIDAPTGAGKTYVFERWIEQTNFARRALFTVPTRALANDKFAEWRTRGWKVGIMTGDITLSPDAPVVVATLEAVQGCFREEAAPPRQECAPPQFSEPSLAGGSSFHLVIIDEYQWLADPDRGNHYEGVILSLPPAVQLLMLSGNVANPEEIAAWLRRLNRKVEIIQHRERPVALEEVDVDDLIHGLPRGIEGFWSRRVAGALREGLGPVLVFAPHRQDAERLARQFARELPLAGPLVLTPEQENLLGPALTKLVRQRVAYHHSGLTYAQRAGVIEPLAKAGQLRAVVATLGLSAGINFSLRSVLITASTYRFNQLEHEIEPHELLQMIGRAGRRGLDEAGFVLCSGSSPRLRRAQPLRVKRAAPLPWALILRQLRAGREAAEVARTAGGRFFAAEPLVLGVEMTMLRNQADLPCGQCTDTGRARLVRRQKNPFPSCLGCALREECLALNPQPTLLWQWQKLGLLDRLLRLTPRGVMVSFFLGPEGLALAAALEDPRYPLDDLVFDCANLFAGDRFAGTNPRTLGRLARVCERTYRRFTVEGWLEHGLPPQYGFGAAEVVRAVIEQKARRSELAAASEFAGRGDIDRLLTEWRSLLRQVVNVPLPDIRPAPAAAMDAAVLATRWDDFRALCRIQLGVTKAAALPELPPLTPEQRRPVNHRFFKAPMPAIR